MKIGKGCKIEKRYDCQTIGKRKKTKIHQNPSILVGVVEAAMRKGISLKWPGNPRSHEGAPRLLPTETSVESS